MGWGAKKPKAKTSIATQQPVCKQILSELKWRQNFIFALEKQTERSGSRSPTGQPAAACKALFDSLLPTQPAFQTPNPGFQKIQRHSEGGGWEQEKQNTSSQMVKFKILFAHILISTLFWDRHISYTSPNPRCIPISILINP